MMMKKTGLLAVLTAGVLLFAGCGGEAKTIDAPGSCQNRLANRDLNMMIH